MEDCSSGINEEKNIAMNIRWFERFTNTDDEYILITAYESGIFDRESKYSIEKFSKDLE